MSDAGDRLPERRHLLGLQQLMMDVAGLVVELLALADVAHDGLDAIGPVALVVRAAGEFHPDGRDWHGAGGRDSRTGAVRRGTTEQRVPGVGIDEALLVERTDVGVRGVCRRNRRSA